MKLLLQLIFILFAQDAFAQYPGGKVMRISGQGSRVIDNKNDAVTITLSSLNLSKTGNWFRQDKSLGLLIETTIQGSDITSGLSQGSTATCIFQGDVQDYNKGQVYLPIEENVLNNYYLRSGNTLFTSIKLNMKLIRTKSNTGFGFVIKGLAELTKTLPFPSSPFDPSIKALTGSINTLLSDKNDSENKISERPSLATVTENFNKSSLALETSTGMFAIVFGSSQTSTGYIDPNNNSNYILTYQTEPTRALLVAPISNPDQKTPLLNDHLLFSIDAYSLNAPNSSAIQTEIEISQTQKTNLKAIRVLLVKSAFYRDADPDLKREIDAELDGQNRTAFQPEGKVTVTASKLLIMDYMNALDRLIQLGSDNIRNLPQPHGKAN